MVGSSNLSGRAIIFNHLAPFRKIESSHKNKNIKVVIDGWGTIVMCAIEEKNGQSFLKRHHLKVKSVRGYILIPVTKTNTYGMPSMFDVTLFGTNIFGFAPYLLP